MTRLKTLLLQLTVCTAFAPAYAQPNDYPKALTTFPVAEYQLIDVPDLNLIGAYFFPGAPNQLYNPAQKKILDLQTHAVTTRAPQKSDPLSGWQRVFVPAKSNDARWANIQVSDVTRIVGVRTQSFALIIDGTDSLYLAMDIRSFPDVNFSYNFPYFWASLYESREEVDFQLIKKYDVENRRTSEYLFKLPDETGYGDFSEPPCHDKFHIWYNHYKGGLYAFDKRDGQVYRYPQAVPGEWEFLGRDSALLYLCNYRSGKIMALNKQWLDQRRVPFDGAQSLDELLQFTQLMEAAQLPTTPDLATFIQGYQTLQQTFRATTNQSIKTALEEIPDLLQRRLYNEPDFAKKSNTQFPGLEAQLPENLLPLLYDWQMEYSIQLGDLDRYAAFYEKLRQAKPDYFEPDDSGLGLIDMACVSKRLAVQQQWQEIKKNTPAPDKQLWEKGALVEELFSGGVCQVEMQRGVDGSRALKSVGNRLPAAWVYSDLVRQHPASSFAAQAVCKIVEYGRVGKILPFEIWDAAAVVAASPCKTEAEFELFKYLTRDYAETRPASLLRARTLGRQLLKANPNSSEKEMIEGQLEEIEAELGDMEGN
ncbi:MAG: hypothetical protein H6574_16285 [Lewinellaceae bacterium]|nr:hypothetical protein [Saprospiraceae bacterium]MCB9332632.1 hypothetical protein [Lewinellaceae bacterium]